MERADLMNWFSLVCALHATAVAADSVSCVSETSNAAIYQCLNDYAKTSLDAGGPADRRYRERLGRLLTRFNLRSDQVRAKSLDSTFSIYVTEESELSESVGSGKCYDFESMLSYSRRSLVTALVHQIDEAALFLSEIQARTWGHHVSILFPIRELNICARSKTNGRPAVFEQRSLVLGMEGDTAMPAAEILQIWNSGSPIRGRELSYFDEFFIGKKGRELQQKINGDFEGIIRDRLADHWAVLNPTGTVRTTALYLLSEAVLKYTDQLSSESSSFDALRLHDRLVKIASGPGFSDEDRQAIRALKDRDDDVRAVFKLWLNKLGSPSNMLYIIENAIGDNGNQSAHLHLALRRINAGLAVLNDKTISVRLEQLMQASVPASQFEEGDVDQANAIEVHRSEPVDLRGGKVGTRSTSVKIRGKNARDFRINADEINAGMVVDLIDDVLVSVQMPKISPEAYRRVSLYQALRDYQSGVRASGDQPALP